MRRAALGESAQAVFEVASRAASGSDTLALVPICARGRYEYRGHCLVRQLILIACELNRLAR